MDHLTFSSKYGSNKKEIPAFISPALPTPNSLSLSLFSERSDLIAYFCGVEVAPPIAHINFRYKKFYSGMFGRVIFVILLVIVAWAYQEVRPPQPKLCGSPGGPPITAPRVKLRDGRHLAYKEHGVPKELAKYKIIFVHGFGSSIRDQTIVLPDLYEELGVYMVVFDRQGYGESDPDPNRTTKSMALDIEELADQLGLVSKFYVVGFSMGGHGAWGCLKYIPHRLAGVALLTPVVNYWWPSFPANLSTEAYYDQYVEDQWALRVAHYAPWLVHWWNTQRWFPFSSVIAGRPNYSSQDWEIVPKLIAGGYEKQKEYVKQQGEIESLHRDLKVGFGKWEFDPMDIKNPFPNNEGSVHLWQGDEDGFVPVTLQRYIAEKLPWIHYHELKGAGHLFPLLDHMKKAIVKTLVLGDHSTGITDN